MSPKGTKRKAPSTSASFEPRAKKPAPASDGAVSDPPPSDPPPNVTSSVSKPFTPRAKKPASASNGAPSDPPPSDPPPSDPPPSDPPANVTTSVSNVQFDHSRPEEKYGIVDRRFYPTQISHERCQQYTNGDIPRPLSVLEKTINDTADDRSKIEVGDSVVHWFKRDLRTRDNRPLQLASQKAKEKGVPLICLFIISPQDYEAHITSAARVDFELRTLEIMKQDLAELDIPLHIETVHKRRQIPDRILELLNDWGAKHMYCGIEYEVDELRREEKLIHKCLAAGISFTPLHDDVVVPPGALTTGAGRQFSVYSPWYRAWVSHIHAHPERLTIHDTPSQNPSSTRSNPTLSPIFSAPNPPAPPNKTLPPSDKDRLAHLWPAGEHAAHDRLSKFLSERISTYKATRNYPSAQSTASLSVHFSAGTLSARSAVAAARDSNTSRKLDGGSEGNKGWISELAWRDFYKHVLAHWPHVCMNMPFKPEYASIEWEYSPSHFAAWCEGRTGYPLIDAAMRQLNSMGYMHNRCRMAVASFLAKDLMIDWRMGERYFMSRLIDGDFASNNGGWGFSASTGVDPQPYFRVFNPVLQSEKFDAEGVYVRKWVEELREVKGRAVHDPYGRGEGGLAERNGYPRMIVEHKASRERCLERYKRGLGRDTA